MEWMVLIEIQLVIWEGEKGEWRREKSEGPDLFVDGGWWMVARGNLR